MNIHIIKSESDYDSHLTLKPAHPVNALTIKLHEQNNKK